MTQVLIARIVLTLIGVGVWGYGQRIDNPEMRLAGMIVLAIALLLRFVPKRWFAGRDSR